jgi:hypothetical protein
MEDILAAYSRPVPDIGYTVVTVAEGNVGVVQVRRDRAKVPYRVSKTLAHIVQDDVYVRHGSHIAKADPEEIAELEAEAARARG